jgi:predicted Zn finger-like uncharacterized protein
MILNCNSCGKKFVVPDNAITASGRAVQCGSCGNKWKQFPINISKKAPPTSDTQKISSKPQKTPKPIKNKKKASRKSREINLYSPEYLARKHGIKLNNDDQKTTSLNNNVSFGFYNSLLMFLVILIFLSRGLYFFQDFIIQKFPFTEFYIHYFFESIKNVFEIWKNLISSY